MQRRTFTAAAMVVGFGVGGLARAQEMVFFRIGSGAVGGTYFPIAGLLAGAVSNPPGSRACEDGGSCGVPGLVAIAQATHASAANVASVESGELQSGLASADIVHLAYNGVEPFAPHPKLRVIANLYPEHLQLVLKKGLPIETLADLAGRRVGIGQPGSGTQVAVRELLAMNDVAEFEPVELDNTASAESLASGELDAYFQVAGAPTPATVQLAAATGIDLYRFSGDEIAAFVEALPYFYESTIPERTYPGVDYAVPTVAVGAQWVTSSDQPAELVHGIADALWNDNNRGLFDNGHANGEKIRPETALDGVSIPLHAGAERYYREAGLL